MLSSLIVLWLANGRPEDLSPLFRMTQAGFKVAPFAVVSEQVRCHPVAMLFGIEESHSDHDSNERYSIDQKNKSR